MWIKLIFIWKAFALGLALKQGRNGCCGDKEWLGYDHLWSAYTWRQLHSVLNTADVIQFKLSGFSQAIRDLSYFTKCSLEKYIPRTSDSRSSLGKHTVISICLQFVPGNPLSILLSEVFGTVSWFRESMKKRVGAVRSATPPPPLTPFLLWTWLRFS